jgi:hypothetical protein
VTAYASKSQQQIQSQDGLAAFQPDFLPNQSQLPMFSDHSAGVERSSAVPSGTIQQLFLQHEPNVMFQNSGSTIAYNESSEQRLIEHAMLQDQENVPPPVAEVRLADFDAPESSLFPWSPAVPTQTPKLNNVQQNANGATQTARAEGVLNQENAAPQSLAAPATEDSQTTTDEQSIAAATKNSHRESETGQQPPNSSPIVSVPRVRRKSVIADADYPSDSQRSSKGKKRKAEAESSEPLNSEDLAIGLPKERYQPRPSRRRSTAVVETPVDYSVVPEKAAKKRRKTVNPTAGTTKTENAKSISREGEPSASQKSRIETQPSEPRADKSNATSRKDSNQVVPTPTKQQPAPVMQPIDRGQARDTLKDLGFMLRSTQSSDAPIKPSPVKSATPTSAKRIADAAAFAMPPPPSSQAYKRSRRSHTTIFEDHVDLGRVQKSPSLSQQQAKRQATLEPVDHPSSQSTRRQHQKAVPHEDDDDEDELSKDHVPDEPVKKKRGRPAKSKVDKAVKSTEKVLDDENIDSDDDDVVQPKKRGRPPKGKFDSAKSAENVLEDSEVDSDDEDVVRPKKRGPAANSETHGKVKSTEKVLDDSEVDSNDGDVVQPKNRAMSAKSKTNGKARSAEKVFDDSEAGSDEDDIVVPAKKTNRASKAQSKSTFKSAEKVLSDSEAEIEEEEEEDDEPPKKKPRGKPSSSKAQAKPTPDSDSHKDNTVEEPIKKISKSKSGDATIDTASPEKPAPATAAAKPATPSTVDKPLPKPNPNSHSPIKPSSKVLHRVGLNRTQRVQPLLKIVRPPAPVRKR